MSYYRNRTLTSDIDEDRRYAEKLRDESFKELAKHYAEAMERLAKE